MDLTNFPISDTNWWPTGQSDIASSTSTFSPLSPETIPATAHHDYIYESALGNISFYSNSTNWDTGTKDGPQSTLPNQNNPNNNGAILTYPPYIFDRSDVRIVFFILYTIVFSCCFFGNLLVILVVTLHWRMRSITNFCLANLAFADLCVGIFCVYQNMVTYLMESWVFGEFMCKMYHFIISLSTTASVLILVVICIERYLAIIHPMTCKQMLTLTRLRITIVFVWMLSAVISSPRFYYFGTLSMPLPNNEHEILCRPNRLKYDSKLMDMISLTMLYLIPLAIISILYTQIGIVLWKSSNTRMSATTCTTPSAEDSSSSGAFSHADTESHINNHLVKPCQCQSLVMDTHVGNPHSILNLSMNRKPVQGRLTTTTTNLITQPPPSLQPEVKLAKVKKRHGIDCWRKQRSTSIDKEKRILPVVPESPFHTTKTCPSCQCQCQCSTVGQNGSPPEACKNDPIVLVKFEKAKTGRGQSEQRNHCTILMNTKKCACACSSEDHRNQNLENIQEDPKSPCIHFQANPNPHFHNCPHVSVSPPKLSSTTTPKRLRRMRIVRSSKYGSSALQSRRRIIRMLIVVVLAFALCHLPFHARKVWQYWSPSWLPYQPGSVFSTFFTPITFLIMYANSAINPILYAFMSKKFRMSFRDLLCCKMRHSLRINANNHSVRSTHVVAHSQTHTTQTGL